MSDRPDFVRELECEAVKKAKAETREAEAKADAAEAVLKFTRDMIAKERNPLAAN